MAAKTSRTILFVFVVIAAALAATASLSRGKLWRVPYESGRRVAEFRPHKDYAAFYASYRGGHTNEVNLFLHVIASWIAIVLLLNHPRYLIAVIISLSLGYIVSDIAIRIPNGYAEYATLILSFCLVNLVLTRHTGFEVIAIPIFFILIGHFLFQKNDPDTNYPTLSVFALFQQSYEVAIGKIPFVIPQLPALPKKFVPTILKNLFP